MRQKMNIYMLLEWLQLTPADAIDPLVLHCSSKHHGRCRFAPSQHFWSNSLLNLKYGLQLERCMNLQYPKPRRLLECQNRKDNIALLSLMNCIFEWAISVDAGAGIESSICKFSKQSWLAFCSPLVGLKFGTDDIAFQDWLLIESQDFAEYAFSSWALSASFAAGTSCIMVSDPTDRVLDMVS